VARAEEAARKQKQAEQAKRIEAEKERLEREMLVEEDRLAEERLKAEERAAFEAAKSPPTTRQTLPTPPLTTLPPTPPPTTQPPTQRGMLVNLTDPGVVPPAVKKAPRIHYPPIALRQRTEGTVILRVLVDENGKVTEVTVVTSAGGRTGLTEAAVKSVKRRVYNPATKDGVAVKAWLPVSVRFTLPAY
jgi:protein TonB